MLLQDATDRDAYESYLYLGDLVENKLGLRVNSYVQKRFTAAVTAAMSMPAGEGRQAVLDALSSGVGNHLRIKDVQAENERLKARLAADNPTALELEDGMHTMLLYLRTVHEAFKKAWNSDKGRGRDMNTTSFAWFEHELNVFTSGMRSALDKIMLAGRAIQRPAQSDSEE